MPTNPLVFVVAEPELHAALATCADLDVWPSRFGSTDEFATAAAARNVPTDREPTVIVVADTHFGPGGGAEFLARFGGYVALIPWLGRGSDDAAATVTAPVTVNALRAAIGEVAEQPVATDDPAWDAVIAVTGRQSPPPPPVARPTVFEIDNTPEDNPEWRPSSVRALLDDAPASDDSVPTWSAAWANRVEEDKARDEEAVARLGFHENDAKDPNNCHVVCVFSSKGGVGKTTVTVNLATRLALVTGLKVAMIDLDVGFGDIGPRIGKYTPTVVDLMRGPTISPAMLDSLPREPSTGVAAVLAPLRPDTGSQATVLHPGAYGRLLDAMKRRFDAVFLDCSVELSDPVISEFAMPSATSIAFVVNNERATIIDARRALDAMCRPVTAEPPGLGLKSDHIALVINQLVDEVGLEQSDLKALLEGWPVAAVIPDDRKLWVGEANARRLLSTSNQAPVLAALDDALRVFVPGVHIPQGDYTAPKPQTTEAKRRGGWFSKLLSREAR